MKTLERSPQWQANAGLRRVLAIWPQLVGAAVAQHSRPTKIYRGALQVTVSSAAWAQTLTFERMVILQKLHTALPALKTEITDLRFATAQWRRETHQAPPTATRSLSDHPSWAQMPQGRSRNAPQTADVAFQQWADRRQRQLASQSRCPQCQSPCPTRELQRWSVCAICATRQWQTPR